MSPDNGACFTWLAGGKRLHMQHGPIDLIVEADGDDASVRLSYERGMEAFKCVLFELVEELPLLRQRLFEESPVPCGVVAKAMHAAALPHCSREFVTPMIAVAGSVADHVLQAMVGDDALSRAYVNNGGDIALWLSEGASFTVGICDNTETGDVGSRVRLAAADGVQGIATSGWRGRSHSLGIADAVTVLAASAAAADAAATLIANAVNVSDCDGVCRQAAVELSPDSDLGDQLVTVDVDVLGEKTIRTALESGTIKARELVGDGVITSAYLSLQGNKRVCSQQTLGAGAIHA